MRRQTRVPAYHDWGEERQPAAAEERRGGRHASRRYRCRGPQRWRLRPRPRRARQRNGAAAPSVRWTPIGPLRLVSGAAGVRPSARVEGGGGGGTAPDTPQDALAMSRRRGASRPPPPLLPPPAPPYLILSPGPRSSTNDEIPATPTTALATAATAAAAPAAVGVECGWRPAQARRRPRSPRVGGGRRAAITADSMGREREVRRGGEGGGKGSYRTTRSAGIMRSLGDVVVHGCPTADGAVAGWPRSPVAIAAPRGIPRGDSYGSKSGWTAGHRSTVCKEGNKHTGD